VGTFLLVKLYFGLKIRNIPKTRSHKHKVTKNLVILEEESESIKDEGFSVL
jgi:hypothetical protein